jgi:hypothetical protein
MLPMDPIDQLVEAFGGIRAMQRKLGEKHASLIQGWMETGNIPHYREPQVRAAAKRHRVRVSADLWGRVFSAESKAA